MIRKEKKKREVSNLSIANFLINVTEVYIHIFDAKSIAN